MKRLNLYVIRSFTGPFIMTFFIVLFVLLMQFLWKYVDDMVGKGLELKLLAEMMFYASFTLLPFAFPLSMLLASIMTFGSLGENYELVAMKSSGISLIRIMKPLFIFSILITVIAFYFANNILPITNLRFTTLLYSVREQRPELVLQEGVFTNEMDGYSIKVGRKNNKSNMMYDLLIYDHTNGKINESVTVADSGYMMITEDKKYMVLNLFDGVNYSEEQANNQQPQNNYPFRRNKFTEQTIRVQVRNFDFSRYDESIFKNASRMLNITQLLAMEDTMNTDYSRRIRNFILEINLNTDISRKKFNLTALNDSMKTDIEIAQPDTIINFDEYFNSLGQQERAAIAGIAIGNTRSNSQNINIYQGQLYNYKKELNKHSMERHRKFTLSIAVLIFFFIGAPLGAIIRRGGLGMPVVVSILLFIAYYIVSMTGEKSAREDIWDMFGGMWFSTFIFLPVGVWLTYKAATDSPVMSAETYVKLFQKLGISRFANKGKTQDQNIADKQ
ncbi:MAG: LptF/LptG family permease [Bacteroidales bacterium]|jgi:lipopolysaccharide export system permease protein|nr:LptF/LptG family permease [Bacteroidales bacterium]